MTDLRCHAVVTA